MLADVFCMIGLGFMRQTEPILLGVHQSVRSPLCCLFVIGLMSIRRGEAGSGPGARRAWRAASEVCEGGLTPVVVDA